MRLLVATLADGTACLAATPPSAQPAAFVYRLGKHTVAIEQFTRTATAMTGEMVQRSGAAVARYQYTLTLAKNGRPTTASIKRTNADGSLPPRAPSDTRFTVTADSIVHEADFADSTPRRAFAARQALINFPTFIYGPIELLTGIAKSGGTADSIPALGLAGTPGVTGITPAGDDNMRLRGGAYAMILRFDADNTLQLVDGSFTTNKFIASRGTGLDLAAIAKSMKPTGANDAKHLFTSRTLTMGDVVVPPGAYTLFVQHTRNGTFLIVNKQVGQWGTIYTASNDLARVPKQMTAKPSHVEECKIVVRSMGPTRGAIEMSWGPSMVSVPFTATVVRP